MLSEKWLVSGINIDPVFQTCVSDWSIDEKKSFPFDFLDSRTRCPYPWPGGRDASGTFRNLSNRLWKRRACSIVHLTGARCQSGGLYSYEGRPVAGFGTAGFIKREEFGKSHGYDKKVVSETSGKPLVILNTGSNNFYHFVIDVMAPASSVLSFLREGLADRVIFYGPKPEEGSFNIGLFKHFQKRCRVPIYFEENDFSVESGFFLIPRLSDFAWSDESRKFYWKESVKPLPLYVSDSVKYFFQEMSEGVPVYCDVPPITIISRDHLRNRKLINESDIYNALSGLGVRSIKMEEYGTEEQISIIKSSKVIIGCHGAGMFNAGFLPFGGMAIEITGRQYVKRSKDFIKIYAATGVNYSYILADEVGDNFKMIANQGNDIEISSIGIEHIVSQCRSVIYGEN